MGRFILNGKELEIVTYPNGEQDLKTTYYDLIGLTFEARSIVLKWYDCSLQDLLMLEKITDMVELDELYIDYFPYQRSDRDFFDNNMNNKGLVVQVYQMIKNMLEKDCEIIVNDPHCKYLQTRKRCRTVYPIVNEVIAEWDHNTVIVFPDDGAYTRYNKLFIGDEHKIVLSKKRDCKTGVITGSTIISDTTLDKQYSKYIIIDDICDRGGTFLSAKNTVIDASKIGAEQAEWHLFVSHNTDCEKHPNLEKEFIVHG